jgi:HD-GYP domain-containing protein (c-di-GMP phosphodiesterase class II)
LGVLTEIPAASFAPAAPIERTRVLYTAPRWNSIEDAKASPDAVEAPLAALLELVEDSAPDVAAHMERTARFARVFALELGLDGALLELVVRTARVHDVGKLAVPPWVVEKPGPLTRYERALMEAHSVIGQKILERKPTLIGLGALVRATHERWDGNGYPDRLKGSAIPLPSRIVAVCDAFDAMTHRRPYRPAVSFETAVEELRRGSGTQFDPGVIETFCAVMDERVDRCAIGA